MALNASPPGLHAHVAWRADVLASALAQVLAEPLADPFAREVVSVPTAGVERWLAQSLSGELGAAGANDGVSAGIEFPSLGRLVRESVAIASGIDLDTDPWQPARLVWQVLATMDDVRDEPWFAVVAEHLYRSGERPGRRFRTARRVAHLFDSYAHQRPWLLDEWSAGVTNVPDDLAWQPQLWRLVRERIGSDPTQRLTTAVQRLTADPALVALPPRLSVFGPTRLSSTELQVLQALAAHRTVHLWLPQARPLESSIPPPADRQHREPGLIGADGHPLALRLGRDAWELGRVLARVPHTLHTHQAPPPATTSLLGALQADVVSGQPPRATHVLAADDRSVQFHACHGPERQVEVLREVVLGLLADDPTLEPRDIVVMCPDIESYAALISASFGGSSLLETDPHHPVHQIPVRLADRSLRQLNPVLGVLQQLFDLMHRRARVSSLVALCQAEPVARRFGFGAEDLEKIGVLVDRAEVRWGVDRAELKRHGMDAFIANTWLAGIDRLLTGIALPATRPIGGVSPVDVASSEQADLIGRLAELVTRLRRITLDFDQPKSPGEWTVSMRRALELITDVVPGDDWQLHHAFSTLADLADAAGTEGPDLTSADVAELLTDAFRGRPTRASFRTGALTMCTLSPMRSVPHRAVVLLGLDDGVFPRSARAVGDDLLARDPLEGERDRASEDRQQLLDAVLSATDTLVVIHSGRDPHSNRPVPMSIPVSDLHEALTKTVSADSRELWRALHVDHPLQPFSAKNFEHPQPFSFDRHGLDGARALTGPRQPARFGLDLTTTLPAIDTSAVELGELISFFAHPLKHFLKARGIASLDQDDDRYSEEITSSLDGLQAWGLRDRIITGLLAGRQLADLTALEAWRGSLPPHQLGRDALNSAAAEASGQVESAARLAPLEQTPRVVQFESGQTLLTGAVSTSSQHHLLLTPSKRKAKQHLELWIKHLALCATEPDVGWQSVLVASPGSYEFNKVRLGPVPAAEASAHLTALLSLYAEGLQSLLRLPADLAMSWQRNKRSRFDWAERWRYDTDRLWKAHFDGPADLLDGQDPDTSDFVRVAGLIWEPIVRSEQVQQ